MTDALADLGVRRAEYVSLGLLLERGAVSGDRPAVRLVQTATFVVRAPAPPGATGAKPQRGGAAAARVMLEQALRAEVEHACPPAVRSLVYIAEPREEQAAGAAAAGAGEAGSCDGSAGPADGEGSAAAGTCTLPDAAPDAEVAVEQAGSEDEGQPAATQDGQQLALWTVAAGRVQNGPTASRSQAVPRLLMYDTLDLLDVKGWGLHLPLPPPPQRPVGASAAGGSSTLGPAPVTMERFVTGAGMLRGGIVLAVRRSPELQERLQAAAAAVEGGCGGAGASRVAADGGGVCHLAVVCVYQVFPWYIRPWLHTLSVLYDGQVGGGSCLSDASLHFATLDDTEWLMLDHRS